MYNVDNIRNPYVMK